MCARSGKKDRRHGSETRKRKPAGGRAAKEWRSRLAAAGRVRRVLASPPVPVQQFFGTLGKQSPNLPPLSFDPRNGHRVVGGRLVPHPGDHGGFGPSFDRESVSSERLSRSRPESHDRPRLVPSARPGLVAGMERQKRHHGSEKIFDVFRLAPCHAGGHRTLLRGRMLLSPFRPQARCERGECACRRPYSLRKDSASSLFLDYPVIARGFYTAGQGGITGRKQYPALGSVTTLPSAARTVPSVGPVSEDFARALYDSYDRSFRLGCSDHHGLPPARNAGEAFVGISPRLLPQIPKPRHFLSVDGHRSPKTSASDAPTGPTCHIAVGRRPVLPCFAVPGYAQHHVLLSLVVVVAAGVDDGMSCISPDGCWSPRTCLRFASGAARTLYAILARFGSRRPPFVQSGSARVPP